MTDEAKQNVTECPNCGAPWLRPNDLNYASRTGACSIKGSGCDYAAGLRQHAEVSLELAKEWRKRAERAEAALRDIDMLGAHHEPAKQLWDVAREALEADNE